MRTIEDNWSELSSELDEKGRQDGEACFYMGVMLGVSYLKDVLFGEMAEGIARVANEAEAKIIQNGTRFNGKLHDPSA